MAVKVVGESNQPVYDHTQTAPVYVGRRFHVQLSYDRDNKLDCDELLSMRTTYKVPEGHVRIQSHTTVDFYGGVAEISLTDRVANNGQ